MENVLNVAYLVEAARLDQLVERARRLGASGDVFVEVTGPWAPYSFATLAEHGEAK